MKKALSILLSLCMLSSLAVVAAVPASAQFAESAVADGVVGDFEYYTLDDGTASIEDYFGDGGRVEVPSVIDGYTVTKLSRFTFKNNEDITEVIIPDTVTEISDESFYQCENLTSVTLPNSLETIGEKMFYKCVSLASIDIPDSVTSIGKSAFEDCTSLKTITGGSSVTEIGSSALYDTAWYKDQPNGVVYFNKVAYDLKGDCPSHVDIRQGTVSISAYLFEYKSALESITLPDTLIKIGVGAFRECKNLNNVVLPNLVTSIGYQAFKSCYALTSIVVPDSVTDIGNHAFYGTAIEFEVVDGIQYIGKVAYHYVNQNEGYPSTLTFKPGTIGIADGALSGTNLRKVTIPGSVKVIGDNAFSLCKQLDEVTIGSGVRRIGAHAFVECDDLNEVTIPASVKEIGEEAFGYIHKPLTIGDYKRKANFTIYGYTGSAAQQYAEDNDFDFISLGAAPVEPTTAAPTTVAPTTVEPTTVEPTTAPEPVVLTGDVNGDNLVNGADAGVLSRYAAGWKGYADKIKNLKVADVNNDGSVNGADAGILARYNSGWKQYAKFFES